MAFFPVPSYYPWRPELYPFSNQCALPPLDPIAWTFQGKPNKGGVNKDSNRAQCARVPASYYYYYLIIIINGFIYLWIKLVVPSIGSIIQVGLSVNSHLSPAVTDSSPMKLFIYTESFINRWLLVTGILSNAFTFNTVHFIFEIFSIILIQLINNLDIYQWDGNVFLRFPMMCCSTSVSVFCHQINDARLKLNSLLLTIRILNHL